MTPDLTCAECRELLPWLLAERLSPAERSAAERHLVDCAACRREAALWSALATTLADEERRIPPDSGANHAWLALRDQLPQQWPTLPPSESGAAYSMRTTNDAPGSGVAQRATLRTASRQPRHRLRRSALALPAAVVLIALTVTLFGLFGAQLRHSYRPAAAATSAPAACASSGLRASLPPNAIIGDISMTSPRDGWAVGWVQHGGQQQAVAPTTLLLRFQNCRWQPFGEGIAAAELFSVSMNSATDGWAVGATVIDASVSSPTGDAPHDWEGSKLLTFHYVDGQWQRVNLPTVASIIIFAKVRMTASGDGWMLIDGGKTHSSPDTVKFAYSLMHYQGGVWAPVPLTFDVSDSLELWDVAAMTPDDCWVVGYGTTTSDTFAVAHYHQGTWTTWSDSQLGVTYPTLYAVTVTGPTGVWVAGSYHFHDANGDHTAPLVMRYDGATWTRERVGDYGDQQSIHDLMTIAAQSPNELWAFPQTGHLSIPPYHMARESDGKWTWIAAAPVNIITINAVVFVSETEGFAAAVTQTPAGIASVLLHYANGAWSAIPTS